VLIRTALLAATALALLPTAAQAQPNVLVVMTDDQPYGSTAAMPFLSAHADEFTTFTEAHVNNSVCCPARATFLTGLYSHHTGIETLAASDFDDSRTLATEFDAAGYETGLFGKYMNGYPWDRGDGYVPEGWDRWVAFSELGADYYDYNLSVDGSTVTRGGSPEDYSTDVLAAYARDFIEGADAPFFALYVPYGPHPQATPAPRHAGDYAGEPVQVPDNLNRLAPSTHPFWSRVSRVDRADMRREARRQRETLLSEDEALESFYEVLAAKGELDETIIVFLTDNGFSLGSHRWLGKRCPWEECEHIPLMIRAPESTVTQTDALVSNVDLAPTIADLAGVAQGPSDGRSLVPLMSGEAATLDRPALLRVKRDPGHLKAPTMWGLRTERWKYMRWKRDVDLYDLRADPGEVQDLAARERYRDVIRRLDRRMDAMRGGTLAPPRAPW
jgi:arylsulfatase A-like enzyme